MVTARSHSEDIVNGLQLGANDYITKPVDFPVALARINTQLSHRRAEQALRESEERYALAAQGANDGLWDWNLKKNTIYFSPRWKSMLGYEDSEIGESPDEWFGRMHESDQEIVKQRIDEYLNGKANHFECEARLRHKDGVFRWMLSRGIMVRDQSGKPLRMAGSQTDITEGKVADPLTGLPNRLLFADRLLQLIEHRKRNPDSLFAVLFLDLDGFKTVNDSLGHLLGDKMLIAVGARLVNSLRRTDTIGRFDENFTVARLGGDEFAILLRDLKDPADAAAVANRLMGELTLPFHLDDREVYTSASIGIAVSTSGYQRPEEFLRDADTAMYRAKSLGKARYEVFDADMRASVTHRLQLETDLRHALERDEFVNFYQPIISLETGRIAGFEALMRWQHPTRGMIDPGEFIGVAEEIGLIRELGWWGLCEACRQISEWRKEFPELTMSVNLSVKQFAQQNFASQLQKLLQEHSLPPGVLKLELTEGSIMADPSAAATLLSQMRALGIAIAIDDFGTGYSSLSYLQRFPLDTLKIDRSFTSAVGSGGKEESIIVNIMPLAQNLGLDVVAEGVETNEQAAFLKQLRCKYAQGYFFSRPLNAQHAGELLQKPLVPTDKDTLASTSL
jgi:diguanylate cyclase (GGDEF)-like protein/PAS domain S-box-containing protein